MVLRVAELLRMTNDQMTSNMFGGEGVRLCLGRKSDPSLETKYDIEGRYCVCCECCGAPLHLYCFQMASPKATRSSILGYNDGAIGALCGKHFRVPYKAPKEVPRASPHGCSAHILYQT